MMKKLASMLLVTLGYIFGYTKKTKCEKPLSFSSLRT